MPTDVPTRKGTRIFRSLDAVPVLDSFVERYTRTARGNHVLIGLRLLLATMSLAVLLIIESDASSKLPKEQFLSMPPLYARPPGILMIITLGLSVIYALIARRAEKSPSLAPKLAMIQIVVDIFLISALVRSTGGVASQFVPLYIISISSAAFVLKWNAALLSAALSAVLFTAISVSIQTEAHSFRVLEFIRLLIIPVCAFFLTGFLAGTLTKRLAIARLMRDEILEGIGEGILVLDRDLKIIYNNRVFLRMLGARSLTGNVENLLGNQVVEQAAAALEANDTRRTELNHKRLDGSILPMEVRIIPISDLYGKTPHGLILALDDITAERKMDELDKHRQRVETMGHISASIAHEIRNPLASIRGAVQEIARSIEMPPNKKILLEIVMSESDRLDQIITDFLHFARMRPPELVRTDIKRVLSDVKMLLATRPEARDMTILLHTEDFLPFSADPEQLRQVFLNLGLNSLQAMAETKMKTLTIRSKVATQHEAGGLFRDQPLEPIDRPGIVVEVQDTGCGMDKSVQRQLFEPFFTTKPAGTGLGLAIVERIVQSHEGMIAVESVENLGTTFCVWLPTDLKRVQGSSSAMAERRSTAVVMR